MKRYKLLTKEGYPEKEYVTGNIYNGDFVTRKSDLDVNFLAKEYPEDWEKVTEESNLNVKDNNFEENVTKILEEIKELLISKNKKYGDSALNPIRVFSKASNIEQIKVRLDDKLSRLRTQHIDEDEDVLNDLLGYLILLKIANNETNT